MFYITLALLCLSTTDGLIQAFSRAIRVQNAASRRSVRIGSSTAPRDVLGDGGVVKVLNRLGTGEGLTDGSVAVVRYRGSADGQVFTLSESQSVTVGDGSMIMGWDEALKTMAVGEQASFVVSSEYGYGDMGMPPVVPPRAPLTFEVEVLDLKGNLFTDATFADAAPLTPRTPSSIKAEFERRQLEKAPEREGLEGFIDWLKSIYVFGFFDAPKGGQLPWYLRPIITFPVMFGIVGVAFSIVVTSGAVTLEREVSTLDNDMISFVVHKAAEELRA